jgi:hypothetical protein
VDKVGEISEFGLFLSNSVLADGMFSNQNLNLGKFWRVLQWKMLVFNLGKDSRHKVGLG